VADRIGLIPADMTVQRMGSAASSASEGRADSTRQQE